jgi:hypothetical protein
VIEERDASGRVVRSTGRPRGSRNRRTLAAEHLPADALPELYKALYAQALGGDVAAANALLARLDPLRKGAPLELPGLPAVADAASARAASAEVLRAVAAGELSPEEAGAVQGLVKAHLEVHEAAGLRADLDRVLEHLGLPREARPGELVAALAEAGSRGGVGGGDRGA